MVALAALFAAAAVYAACCSFSAFRWRERNRFWLFLGASFPLSGLAVALLCVGMGYPQLDEQLAGNMGFGPEWNCAANVYGGGICLRKTERPVATRQPAAEQKTP
jgi:hypothetical protein